MNADDRVEVQEWWTRLGREHRRRDDRVRHGDRQGRRALRLPPEPAEGTRVVLAGDRPRRPRRRAVSVCELFACPDDVPTLENFAFGDTPTPRRSRACSTTIFAHEHGDRFAVSENELSSRHDVRPLVLKTILTYLELDGFLVQGTPFYAGYSVRPASGSFDDVYAAFDPDRAEFLRRVVASGKERAHLDERSTPTSAVPRRGTEPDRRSARLPRAAGPGRAEGRRGTPALHAAEPAGRRLDELRDRLAERFDRREQSEADRIERVVVLVDARRLPGERRSSATSARPVPSRAVTVRIA